MEFRSLFLFFFSLLLLFINAAVLQAQHAPYFPNTVIVKYKTEQQISDIRSKGAAEPLEQVQRLLSKAGVLTNKPFWDARKRKSPVNISAAAAGARRELARIHEITYSGTADPAILAAKLSALPAVEYAEPKYIRTMQFTPDDPVGNPYLNFHNFDRAWDLTKGSSEVVIAIVDGGVGYLHPDLFDKLWINTDEIPSTQRAETDQDGNGTVTSAEVQAYLEQNNEDADNNGTINLFDGIHPNSSLTTSSDTDGNGFADDLYGWDFWDSGGVTGPVEDDNNPIHDGTDHGTHVAGIAAAATDNGAGIYGTGFNSLYMAVKAGGTSAKPNGIGFGFEGIIYAAEQGADIINCSWGGGGFSDAELDVIEFATSSGSLVVAAAGNDAADELIFPAGYQPVLAVGSVETTDNAATYTNYGFNLDVLTTGSGIQSTVFNNEIDASTGTSMASPVAAGLAGLIKALNPGWSPRRIATQIRATAISIDQANEDRYANKLGGGKVDAFEALNAPKPGIVIRSATFLNSQGEKLGLEEDGELTLDIINYGEATGNLELLLSNLDNQEITVGSNTRQVGSLGTGQTAEVSFPIRIHRDFDLAAPPLFRVDFRDPGKSYEDFGIAVYDNILFDVMAVNNVKTSHASDGTIGFTNPFEGKGGVGFIPREPSGTGYTEGNNLLFEGGLMMSIEGNVYDAVRSSNGGLSRDFDPQKIYRIKSSGETATAEGSTTFTIGDSSDVRRATIHMQTFAYDEPALSNVVYVKYTVTNPSSFVQLENIYLGIFNDWDMGDNALNNSVRFSSPDSILYVADEDPNSTEPLVAVAQLGNITSLLAIDNTVDGQVDSVTFGLYDGYTDREKRASLTAGTVRTSVSNTDVSAVAASGPYGLGPRASFTTGFIYAFGHDETELRNQIAEARLQAPFPVSGPGLAVSDRVPQSTRIFPNYPNPFNPSTQLRVDIQKAQQVNLTVYDVLGRKIRVIVDRKLEARTHIFTFNAEGLSSGVYFARLKTENGIQTIPMTLIK